MPVRLEVPIANEIPNGILLQMSNLHTDMYVRLSFLTQFAVPRHKESTPGQTQHTLTFSLGFQNTAFRIFSPLCDLSSVLLLGPAPSPSVLESSTVHMGLSSSLVMVRGVLFTDCWQVGVAMHMDHPLSVSESRTRLWGLYIYM